MKFWDFIQRHKSAALKVRRALRMSEETFHLAMAGVIGLMGGLIQLACHLLEWFFEILFLGSKGDIVQSVNQLAPWLRVVIPSLGGLAAGWILQYGLHYVRSSGGLMNLLEVVVAGDGRLRARPALVNALSSLVSLSSGASVGREGPIIQLAAALSSRLGQKFGWPPYRLRLMVACGAASGLASGFNAPIAGAIFACQIVLGTFSMTLFAPVVFASVVASVFSRSFMGIGPLYEVPSFTFISLKPLPIFLILGVAAGAFGALFLFALRRSEKFFQKWKVPLFIKLGVAGLVVGTLAVFQPQVWGNGYRAASEILQLQEAPGYWGLLLALFAAKFIATTITIGAGTVGGIFTPTLFLGAALGSGFGALVHWAGWFEPVPLGVFGLVGMGSMLAATTHSPLLSMITLFEISLNYSLMPPIMLSCVVSTLIARRFTKTSIYTEPLRRKGLESASETGRLGGATALRVGDLMHDPVPPLNENDDFKEISDRFLSGTNNFLPVVDDRGCLVGMVALQDLKESLGLAHALHGIIASDIMRPPPGMLTPDQRLMDAMPVLTSSELRNVPVVDTRLNRKLIGRVSRGEALALVAETFAN